MLLRGEVSLGSEEVNSFVFLTLPDIFTSVTVVDIRSCGVRVLHLSSWCID